MRLLTQNELINVTGGCGSPCPPTPCHPEHPEHPTNDCKTKNNNGYGNGPESGPPPGNSGDHNPQLTTWNSGPKGPR
jgi:hypothetical protein